MVWKYVSVILSDRRDGGNIKGHGGRGVGRMKGNIIGWEADGRRREREVKGGHCFRERLEREKRQREASVQYSSVQGFQVSKDNEEISSGRILCVKTYHLSSRNGQISIR